MLIEMAHRRSGLSAAIVSGRGFDRAVPVNEPDNPISAGVGIEVKLGGDVAKQVRIDSQAAFAPEEGGDLGSQSKSAFRPITVAWKEPRRRPCKQERSIAFNVEVEQLTVSGGSSASIATSFFTFSARTTR